MAKKNVEISSRKQKRKKNKRLPIIIGMVVVILLGVGGYFVWQMFSNPTPPTTGSTNNNAKVLTEQQKAYLASYEKLKPFSGTEEEAQLAMQNFVVQFFTLSNVETLEQMGGLDFIMPGTVDEFKVNASGTYLFRLEELKEMYGLANLPTVDTVTINEGTLEATESWVNQGDKNYPGYKATVTITYANPESSSANNLTDSFPTQVNITVFYDSEAGAWYVYETNVV
ncbi:hypothetical protein [Culicoidibacter larvae]|uniref:Uncharacterized protein n=1 Tax=Culicoidibacter larvae TaxID=2579976 RepID=A0A5R8QBQ6_9FIRM|nr:hypothetical protein [Culicoidibacter larvae]TLG73942.1 hypothetical protein FEZ08_07375 [Culicoidibacter larvae]